MKYKESFDTIAAAINVLSSNELLNKDIIRKVKGKFIVHNKFVITKTNNEWIVTNTDDTVLETFILSATSISWCLALLNNRIDEANVMLALDKRLSRKQNDVEISSVLLQNANLEADRRDITLSRISEYIQDCRVLKADINTYSYKIAKPYKYIQN